MIRADPPRGILFDYGNTLFPFGRREIDAETAALVDHLASAMPGTERQAIEDRLRAVRLAAFRSRRETLLETDFRDVLRQTAEAFGRAFTGEEVDGLTAAHRDVFIGLVTVAPAVFVLLGRLRDRGIPLGLVSNYSHGEAIHASLEARGLRPSFDAVIVSADLGIVKPHPEIFLAGARGIGIDPREILFVGDNARLDIAGAQATGMKTALVTEHLDGAYHFERPGEDRIDVTPDLVLGHLADLYPED